MKMIKSTVDRRDFLRRSGLLSLSVTSALATQGTLGLLSSALANEPADFTDYRALVCVFLYGGSDSMNMFVPTGVSEYATYQTSRTTMAVPRADLLEANGGIGFNPLLPNLHRLYDRGDAAVVANVGNLIEPITRQQYMDESVRIPIDLFAHDQQQEQSLKSYSSRPSGAINAGWGGRLADLIEGANGGAALPPSFSIDGTNYWSPGNETAPLSLHPRNGLPLVGFLDGSNYSSNRDREATLEAILNLPRSNALQRQSAESYLRARNGSREVRQALADSPTFQTPFNGASGLATQLRMTARLIAGRDTLRMQRQVFFVSLGGWDTHGNQEIRLPVLMRDLDESLASFYATLEELGVADNVTTFTSSDFGRTLTSNGDGTDHGWGGHYLVMGGAVRGNQLYGQMPNYNLNGPDDVDGTGRMVPTRSINEFGAVMSRWMGLDGAGLNTAFPDLVNFGDSWQTELNFLT